MLERLVNWVARKPGGAIVILVLLTLAAWPAARQLRLSTNVLDLLPSGSKPAQEFRQVEEVFGGLETVFIVVRASGDDLAARVPLQEAASRIATRLKANPEVATARSGISEEEETYWLDSVVKRSVFFLPGDWESTLRARLQPTAIRQRAHEVHSLLVSPAGPAVDQLLRHDPLGLTDVGDLIDRVGGTLPVDPLTGGFMSVDGTAALVVVTPIRTELDVVGGERLEEAIDTACDAVSQEIGDTLRCNATGGPLYAAHDARIMRQDLQWTVLGTAFLCALILVFALDSLLLPLIVMIPLLAALVWTGAVADVISGRLTAAGVGFAAVLIGLGVDYGIHAAVRFREARFAGLEPEEAMRETGRSAGYGIWTSALTTAAGFGVLAMAHLRPLRELGEIVAIGIGCMLAASLLGTGGLLRLFGTRRPFRHQPGPLWRGLGSVVEWVTSAAEREAHGVMLFIILSVPLALWGASQVRLSADLRALRPVDHPALVAERLLIQKFGIGLDTATIAVPGRDRDEALEKAAAVSEALRQRLGSDLSLASPSDWMVSQSTVQKRLTALHDMPVAEAVGTLQFALRDEGLSPAGFAPGIEALMAIAAGHDPDNAAPPPPELLGPLLQRQGDRTWAGLHLRLPLNAWPEGPPPDIERLIRNIAPGAAIASAPRLGVEIRRFAGRDLVRLSAIALAAITIVVLVSFAGAIGVAVQALLPVCLAALWTLGIWGAIGRPLDLVSLAVLPIVLGIGIDDGLHALHGARQRSDGNVAASARAAGRAMFLTSLTTCAGFSSLALSRVPGLRSGGMIVALGVVACLLATLVVLPAISGLTSKKR